MVGLPPELVMQLMNQGLSNRQFVGSMIKLRDELESAAVRRPYVKALTEDVSGRREREAATQKYNRRIAAEKVGYDAHRDAVTDLKWRIEEARRAGKSKAEIDKLKQDLRHKEEAWKTRPTVEFADEEGLPVGVKTSPEFAASYSIQRRAADRAAGKVETEAQKTEFEQARDSNKMILELYGESKGLSLFLDGKKPIGESSNYQKMREKAMAGDIEARKHFKQFQGNMHRMGSKRLYRASLPPGLFEQFKVGVPKIIRDNDSGLALTVIRERGNDYLTITRIHD